MPATISSAIKPSLKAAGVRRFVPMGEATAKKVVDQLKAGLPISARHEPKLIEQLAERGYHRAGVYLRSFLPYATIGINFDARESELLSQLDSPTKFFFHLGKNDGPRARQMWLAHFERQPDQAVAVLDRLYKVYRDDLWRIDLGTMIRFSWFTALAAKDEAAAGRMWRAYFERDRDDAVDLLIDLRKSKRAPGETDYVKAALFGAGELTDADTHFVYLLLGTADAMHDRLPRLLAKLDHPVIWQAIAQHRYDFLINQFVSHYTTTGKQPRLDFYRKFLTALGPRRAFTLYARIAAYDQFIDRDRDFVRQYPNAKVFCQAMGNDAAKAAEALAPIMIKGMHEAFLTPCLFG